MREIRLSVGRLVRFFCVVLAVFFIGSLAVQYVHVTTGHGRLAGLNALFNLDGDQTAPTWFNSLLLFFACAGAWLIRRDPHTEKGHRAYWALLGLVFLLMSVDEVARFHETVGHILGKRYKTEGYLHFAFVIPGTLLAGLLFAWCIPFLRSLPRPTAAGLLVSGAVYLCGVIGVEAISSNWFFHEGDMNMVYRLLTDIEETLEMLGLIALLSTLFGHLRRLSGGSDPEYRIRITP